MAILLAGKSRAEPRTSSESLAFRVEGRVFFLREIFSSSGERCQLLEISTGEKYRILYSVYHHRVPFNCSFQDPFEAVFRLGQSRNLRVKHRKNVRDTL